MASKWLGLGVCAVIALGGCGNGEEVEGGDGMLMPRSEALGARGATPISRRPSPPDTGDAGQEGELLRETFIYSGGPRDPFNSLLAGTVAGPELADLQLVGVYEDLAVPSNSVVVLREKVGAKRHQMRVGDRLGRIRLAQIQPREAVFMINDLGVDRRETLSLRTQEDTTP